MAIPLQVRILEKIKEVICDYYIYEFNDEYGDLDSCFEDLKHVGLAYTTDWETGVHDCQAEADLIDMKLLYYFDGEPTMAETFESAEDFLKRLPGLLSFGDLINKCIPKEECYG